MPENRFRDIEWLIRGDLRSLEPYEPIEPFEVLSGRSGVPVDQIIKLDGNENPYGCSPRVNRALSEFAYYHIYPDPLHRMLEGPLERYVGTGREHIVIGSGSDELIDLILRLFLEPRDKVINSVPTFGMYSFSTKVCGGITVNVSRDASYNINVDDIKSVIDERTKAVFIASPNNPTGNVIPEKDLLELLRTGLMVIVDEAYYEFSGTTFVGLVTKHPNLIVLRTFSKWAGLGGLRVGYGIFPTSIAELIRRIKIPYNVNIAGMIAAKESLADVDYLMSNVKAMILEREHLSNELKKQGILSPWPSRANFVLCRVLKGQAKEIKNYLEYKGIFIRYFNTPLLKGMLRISVGRPEHTEAVIKALAQWEGDYKNGKA